MNVKPSFLQRLSTMTSVTEILEQFEQNLGDRLGHIEQSVAALSERLGSQATMPKVVIATDDLVVVESGTFFFAFPPSQLNHALSYLNPSFDLGMRSFISNNAKAGMHFVDIGANCGTLAGIAARAVGPEGKVVAVEPIEELAPFIRRNGVLNGPLTPFEVRSCCAGAEEGEVSFQVFEFDNRVSTIHSYVEIGTSDSTKTVVAKIVPAKDLIPEGDNPLFIKIDAEGNELAILESLTGNDSPIGSRETVIVFEYAEEHLRRAGTEPTKLLILLDNLEVTAEYMNPLTGIVEKRFGHSTIAKPGNLVVRLPNGLPHF